MKKNTGKEMAVVPIPPKKELVLEGDPDVQLAFAMKAANALMKAVSQKKNPVMIRGEQYLEYGDWQTLARFFGATAAVEWTKPITDGPKVLGYEARATVLHQGMVISSAEAMCMRSEANWRSRDEFMLRSMAQTRAAAKALRNAYGWVAELAGMKSTPAEEMDSVAQQRGRMEPYTIDRVIQADEDEPQGKRVVREGIEYPPMTSKNDSSGLPKREPSKDTIVIKELLSQLGKPSKTAKEAMMYITLLTGGLGKGLKWDPGENDSEIIQALQQLNVERIENEQRIKESGL